MKLSKEDDDVSGYSPQWMICRGEAFHFDKQSWTVVIHKFIQLFLETEGQFGDYLGNQVWLYTTITNGDPSLARIGKSNGKGSFIVPERNGWHYIPEGNISVRRSTSNIMLEIIRRIVIDTDYEHKIVLIVKNKDEQLKYIHL